MQVVGIYVLIGCMINNRAVSQEYSRETALLFNCIAVAFMEKPQAETD